MSNVVMPTPSTLDVWPSLRLAEWQDTCDTLHLWSQIVGKVRMELSTPINHWWHITLYITSRGMTTSPIPYGTRSFEIDFDFVDHRLIVTCSNGPTVSFGLYPRSVAEFYRELKASLQTIGVEVEIDRTPQEVLDKTPYDQDEHHASYNAEYANRFWRVLAQSDRVMSIFRSRFLGKTSPVQLFWGSFDLALSRFSGRGAPEHPGVPIVADFVTREAYSHEESACGFWPGSGGVDAAYYAYAYPAPAGFKDAAVRPAAAYYDEQLGEFLLAYEDVRTAPDPDAALLDFLQSTDEAAANLGGWDRAALER